MAVATSLRTLPDVARDEDKNLTELAIPVRSLGAVWHTQQVRLEPRRYHKPPASGGSPAAVAAPPLVL